MYHFEFEYPLVFLLLFLILCIYKCPATIRTIFFPHLQLFTKFTHWINREKLLYSLIFTLLVTALASPIGYDSKNSSNREGRDLVFVLDTSGSMGESGYSQDETHSSKFDTLIRIIQKFIQERYDDNVGVSIFGSFAYASVPLTYDMKAVSFLLEYLEVGIAGENTAIGDGIENALTILKYAKAKNRVIILVTDGYQNGGHITIKDAIKAANKQKVKIYTIGIGSSSDFDRILLQRIAKDTGAKMFQAKNAQELQDVYSTLNTLEPSKIRSQNYLNKQMFFSYPLTLALLLLLYLLSRRKS